MSNSTELLRDKKVIVIGGSAGIGRSVAAAALAHRASVVISSSSHDRVAAAVEILRQTIQQQDKSGVSVRGQALDIKDFEALKAFLSQEGPFDHLVITAGSVPGNLNFPSQEIDQADKNQFDSRYWAVIVAAQHIYKNSLIKQGGSITLTTGTSTQRPFPGWTLATGLLGSVESSTRGLAIDLKPIRVNTISPGVVRTELFSGMSPEARESFFKMHEEKLPAGHVAEPDEVAEAYIFAMKASNAP